MTGPTTATVTYTPALNFNGLDSFLFLVDDGTDSSVQATVAITVSVVNDGPQANPQSGLTTSEDKPMPIALTGSDPEGDPLTYTIETPPTNGTLSGTPPNVVYTPFVNFSGPDEFTFSVSDGSLTSASAPVTITVNPVNDTPTATGFSKSTPQDTPVTLTLLGSDPEGAPLTFTIVTKPTHGSVGPLAGADVTYTPNPGVTGVDSFTFAVSDGGLTSTPATVLITVTPTICPSSQGFWKTHLEVWPVSTLTLGSRSYTQAKLLAILNTAVKGDASLILAHQLIAARLNLANGSDPTQISLTITHADGLLSGFAGDLPYKVKPSSPSGQAMVNDANTLDRYNNGQLTPQCDCDGVGEACHHQICDIDGNDQVDRNDINAILAARNMSASPGDPRDVSSPRGDGVPDGVITVDDGRYCTLRCTKPQCAP